MQGVGSEALARQNPPRLHGRGCAAPPTHHEPAVQPTQASSGSLWVAASVALRNVPASHAAGICTTLPVGQLKPAAHSMHAVAPAVLWYVPSAHAAQSAKPDALATEPAAHGVGAAAPRARPAGSREWGRAPTQQLAWRNRRRKRQLKMNQLPFGQSEWIN